MQKLGTLPILSNLEAFNGSYFFGLPGQPQDGGAAAIGMWVDYSGSTALSGANKKGSDIALQMAIGRNRKGGRDDGRREEDEQF